MSKKLIRDLILIGGLIIAFTVILIVWLVKTKEIGTYAVISYKNEEVTRLELNKDTTYEIQGDVSLMHIVVEAGYVYVLDSGCSNQICVNHEKINKKSQVIACIPNSIIIEVV